MIIRQTRDVHRQIADLLGWMRPLAGERGDELPVRSKPPGYTPGQTGFNAGFGGGFMGGMGGGFGAPTPGSPSGAVGADNQLLKGLQDAHRRYQGRQLEELQKMYKQGGGFGGSSGVRAGGMF